MPVYPGQHAPGSWQWALSHAFSDDGVAMIGHLILLFDLGLAVLAVMAVRRYPVIGWLTLAGFAISAQDWAGLTPLVTFGGLAVYPADAASIVLLAAIVTTPDALRRVAASEYYVWIPVAALSLLSLRSGMSQFGLNAAGNEARSLIQLGAATCWVWGRMRLPGFRRDLLNWSAITAVGLVVVALVHIRSRGLGAVDKIILVNGDYISSRPLTSSQGLILGLVGLAWITTYRSRSARLLGFAFVVVAVIAQNRSDWAALLAAAAALLLLVPGVRRRVLGYGILTAMVVAIAYTAGLLDPLIAKFNVAYHSRGTFVDRQFAWRYLISQQNKQGGATVLVGQPFGTGYARRVPGGSIETFAPHNWYVLLYLRIGLVGAGLVTFALFRGFWTNVKRRDPIGVAWSAGLMTYCLAYNLQMYLAPILAVALTARSVAGRPTEPTDTSAPTKQRESLTVG